MRSLNAARTLVRASNVVATSFARYFTADAINGWSGVFAFHCRLKPLCKQRQSRLKKEPLDLFRSTWRFQTMIAAAAFLLCVRNISNITVIFTSCLNDKSVTLLENLCQI